MTAVPRASFPDEALGFYAEREDCLMTQHTSHDGQALLEYSLIILFVTLVVVAAVALIGTDLAAYINGAANSF